MPQHTPHDTSVRPARQSDLVTVGQLARRIWHAHYPGIITNEQIDYMLERDYSLDALRGDLAAGVSIDLLESAGTAIGFAAYGPTGAEGEIKLHKIYLDVSLHGRGLGSLLLEHVENAVAERGYTRIILQVNKRNEKAIAAYLRNGYRKERALVVDIGGGFVMDDYLMTKSLDTRRAARRGHSL